MGQYCGHCGGRLHFMEHESKAADDACRRMEDPMTDGITEGMRASEELNRPTLTCGWCGYVGQTRAQLLEHVSLCNRNEPLNQLRDKIDDLNEEISTLRAERDLLRDLLR